MHHLTISKNLIRSMIRRLSTSFFCGRVTLEGGKLQMGKYSNKLFFLLFLEVNSLEIYNVNFY